MDKEYLGVYIVVYYDKIEKKFKIRNDEQYQQFLEHLKLSRPIYEIRYIPKNSIFCY